MSKIKDDDLYKKRDKIFYKKRQCPFCDKDLMVKGLGNDFVELTCEDHPNVTLYLTEKDPMEIFANKG